MTISLTSQSKWAEFPASYRMEEVSTILRWVALGESGVVIGGSGTGKSNIAGYIPERPDVWLDYLLGDQSPYLFLLLDLNGLPSKSSASFYRSMLVTIQRHADDLPELHTVLAAVLTQPADRDDPLTLYLALQDAHRFLISQVGKQVIWIFDRFEDACQRLDADTLNSLRSLRDQHKDQLAYIVFSRKPLSHFRPPTEYDELHELLIMHECYVGGMTRRDGHWVAQQVMNRYQTSLPAYAIETIFDLCGGWPAFLKVAYSALADGKLPMQATEKEWRRLLLSLPAMQRNCQEIWESFSTREQNVLLALALQANAPQQDNDPPLDELAATALEKFDLVRSDGDNRTLFSPVFADFVRAQRIGSERGIRIVDNIVYQDGLPLPDQLTPLEFRLLSCFLGEEGYVEQNGKMLNNDDLMDCVWGDGDGDSTRLSNLIRLLRRKINRHEHDYIQNYKGRGYQFVQAG